MATELNTFDNYRSKTVSEQSGTDSKNTLSKLMAILINWLVSRAKYENVNLLECS